MEINLGVGNIKDANQLQWSFLTNVYDSSQANIVKSILEQNEIPVLEKRQGTGAYMEIVLGISNTGIDLYVPDSQLAEAQMVINVFTDINMDLDYPEESDTSNELGEADQRKGIGKAIVILLFIIPLVISIIYLLMG